jgi:imidazolonepropionase-like amidohydrolase
LLTAQETRQTKEAVKARVKPPKTSLIGLPGAQLIIQSDVDTTRVSNQVNLAIDLEPPLAYLSLLKYWDRLGQPDKLKLFDGVTTFDLSIGKGPAVPVSKGTLQSFRIDSGLGEDYVFLDADFRLVGVVAGAFDMVDVNWAGDLDRLKELVTEAELRANQGVYQDVLVQGGDYLLQGGTVIDVRTGDLLRDVTVEVMDGRVVDVRPRDRPARGDAPVIDVSGKFLVPGLFDMHCHFYYTEQAINYLGGGVTTVREMGGDLEKKVMLRDAFGSPDYLGPSMYLFGLVDGDTPAAFGNIRLSSPDGVAVVAERFDSLALVGFKIYGELDAATFREIANEAKKRGFQMIGHLPRQVPIALALESGMDQFSHSVTTSEEESVRDNARLVAQFGGWVDPTRGWEEILARPFGLPLSAIDTQAVDWTVGLQREVLSFGVDAPEDTWKEQFERIMGDLKVYREEGVQLLPGTDGAAGVSTLHRELELFAQFGMTNLEALRSATIEAARALGVEDVLGSIEPGKVADIVVLDTNPLEGVAALRKPVLVIKSGEVLDARALRLHGGFVNP